MVTPFDAPVAPSAFAHKAGMVQAAMAKLSVMLNSNVCTFFILFPNPRFLKPLNCVEAPFHCMHIKRMLT